MIVALPSRDRITAIGSVLIVQTVGVGVGVGVAVGVGVGVAVGVGVGVGVDEGVGVGTEITPPESGVGIGVGLILISGVANGPGVGVAVAITTGVGVEVALEVRSETFRLTLGTESSKTLLSTVTSPEPVTSTETVPVLFFNLIETWALDVVSPLTVFHVRPRQSKAIVSTVSKVTSSGSGMVLVSMSPSPSRSIVTV